MQPEKLYVGGSGKKGQVLLTPAVLVEVMSVVKYIVIQLYALLSVNLS